TIQPDRGPRHKARSPGCVRSAASGSWQTASANYFADNKRALFMEFEFFFRRPLSARRLHRTDDKIVKLNRCTGKRAAEHGRAARAWRFLLIRAYHPFGRLRHAFDPHF